MKNLFSILLIVIIFSSCTTKRGVFEGDWTAALVINDTLQIPFILNINESKVHWDISVYNSRETIQLDAKQLKDSLFLKFPAFDSELRLKIVSKNKLRGKWYNYAKGDYTMDFYAHYGTEKFEMANSLKNVSGHWEVHFDEGSESEWPAIGIFIQSDDDQLFGTFRTETGDYRYLFGALNDDKFQLSSFDGAHAFLFKAELKNDALVNGKFYSGKHYETNWVAYPNEDIELADPYELTQLVSDEAITFTFPNYDFKSNISYPSEQIDNKVVILQIMGSWCPNCMDESRFFSQLYNTYYNEGLEIIGVAFETPEDTNKISNLLNQYREDLEIEYTILYGGKANKTAAGEAFPFLNHVLSFPTSIIIDKTGNVQRIHTGFNGPATEEAYSIYKIKTFKLIEQLLAE